MTNPAPCSEHTTYDPGCPLCNLQDQKPEGNQNSKPARSNTDILVGFIGLLIMCGTVLGVTWMITR